MSKQAPNPIDIQDFQFKLHCRLKIFENQDNKVFERPYHTVSSASRFGLIFVGTVSNAFKVIQVSHVETLTQQENDETDYKCRKVSLPSVPTHLSVNCDSTKLAVVVENNGCSVAIIYEIASFLKKDVIVIQEIRLSTSPGVGAVETTWNPTLPNVFTVCKTDGTLGVYEFKETGVDINELPIEAQATSMCWSPKGKQIAVGSANGKITQYKPDLKAMKVINAPPLNGTYSVVAIQWISSFQFIAVYKSTNTDADALLLVVDAPKVGDVVYTNYGDICYSYGNTRPVQFYTIHEPLWNILLVGSSNSMEVGVLGSEKEQWTQWTLADTARAELPLSSSQQETLPVGLALDKSAVEPVVWGEHSLPPAPFLFVLSHYGVLCCFRMVNIKNGVQNICQAPEPLADTSGLNLFMNAAAAAPKAIVSPIPSKPALIPTAQILSQPKEVPQPPKEVKFNLPTSLPSSSIFASPESSIKTANTPSVSEAAVTVLVTPKISTADSTSSLAANSITDVKLDQDETDLLIGQLVREECEALEKELKALIQKGKSINVEIGSDEEATQIVQDTDSIEKFLAEVVETSTVQGAEVHTLKQGLIQTWAWYEDARSRFMQLQDSALDTLFRIQQLDPVSQRYMANIEYLTYYLESQLIQAGKVLDEQWENFQDSRKKVSKLKIPTVETIYQTMVRQSAILQKQKYILKDISARIRAKRSSVKGKSLFVSLNNVEQLENDLLQLQLDPNNILSIQYERVLEKQKLLTSSKIKKLEKMLSEKEITHISVNKPQLSNTSLQAILNNSAALKRVEETTVFGAGMSPICTTKSVGTTPKIIEFVQSTPKTAVTIPAKTEKVILNFDKPVTSTAVSSAFPTLPPKQEQKSSFDFNAGIKKTFTFASQPTTVSTESSAKTSQTTEVVGTTATNSSFTFSVPSTAPAVASTSTPQFSFGSTSPFTSLFTNKSEKPAVVATESNKSSTSSSAFVPTTQLAFTFTAKPNSTITTSATNLSTKTSSTVFSFSPASNEAPHTSTDIFASSAIKSSLSPKTSLSSLLPESTTNSSVFSSPNTSVTSTTKIATNVTTSATVTVSTTAQSKTADKPTNLFAPNMSFSFSNTQNSIFSFKAPTSQGNQNSSQSIFSPLTKSPPQISIFSNVSKPETSSATSSKSVFSPPVTPEKDTSVTAAEADSTSAAKPSSAAQSTTTSSIFGSVISSSGANPTVPSSTSKSSLLGTATSPLFGTTATNLFETKATVPSITGTQTSTGSNVASTFLGGNLTTAVTSTPTTIAISSIPPTTFAPTSPVFGGLSVTSVAAPSVMAQSAFGALTTTNVTTTASILGGLTSTSAATTPTSAQPAFGFSISSTATTSVSTSPAFGALATSAAAAPSTTFTVTPFAAPAKYIPVPATTASIFGTPTATTTSSMFAPATSPASLQTTNTSITTVSTPTAFGVPPTTSSIFRTLPASTSSSVFASSSVFGSAPNTVFGQPTTTTSSLFSTPKPTSFGEPLKTAAGPFGTQSNAFENSSSIFAGAPVFGAPASTSNSIFASSNASTPAFGPSNSVFGNATTTNSGFAQTPTSSFSFSAAAANIPNAGFSKPPFAFTPPQGSADQSAFSFNSLNMGASTTTGNTSFGTGNPFAKSTTQEQKPAFGGGSLFGTPSSTTTSIFGGGSQPVFGNSPAQSNFGSPPAFGSGAAFGQAPAFGQPAFGSFSTPQQTASFSGGAGQSVAQTGFGAFGQTQKSPGFGAAPVFSGSPSGFGAPPSFGSSPGNFGAPPAFGSPGKVFGESSNTTVPAGGFSGAPQQQNSTFANLANQNTIGFGALAQQSSNLPASAPFQSSSFSTWR